MILSGCWTSPSIPQSPEKEIVFISIPSSLTQHFCEFKGAGDSVATLTDGFIYNTVCGQKYQAQMSEQQEYLKNVKEGDRDGQQR